MKIYKIELDGVGIDYFFFFISLGIVNSMETKGRLNRGTNAILNGSKRTQSIATESGPIVIESVRRTVPVVQSWRRLMDSKQLVAD